MTIYAQPNLTGGIDSVLIDIASSTHGAFPIGILIFTFFIIVLGGTSSQNRRMGYADYPMWILLASFSILMLSLFMTIKLGLITITTLGIVIALNILSAFWYFMSNGKTEQ